MNQNDQVRVVVTIRIYDGPRTFISEVMHRRLAEMIFFLLPYGPHRVSSARYVYGGITVTVEIAGVWDFTGLMSDADAFIVIAELERIGFDVASGMIRPEPEE